MDVYFDNAATTKPYSEVIDIMTETLTGEYGNPSSKHRKGFIAEQYVKQATQIVASTLKVQPKELIFTSGGTESNNLALIGTALANKRSGNHIITSAFEHPSVYNALTSLEDFGFKIDFIPVDEYGKISPDKLCEMITSETIMVSIMFVNNEVGSVQDIKVISNAIKQKKKDILLHVDAIQAYGKYAIDPKKLGIDLLSISGHKIHGPKGSGVLYVRDKVKLKPIIYGGEQQRGYRSGTENVPAIAGFGKAAEISYSGLNTKIEHLYRLKESFVDKISKLDGIHINGIGDNLRETAPHIVSVSFEGIKSEVLLHSLEEKGIYVSSGSACSSNHPGVSGTLVAIGVRKDLLDSTLRFSFNEYNTIEEIDYTVAALEEMLPTLRRFRHV